VCVEQSLPVTHCGAASHPDVRHSMPPEPLIPKPTLQLYVVVDPSSVAEYTAAIAFTTTGGGPQSVTMDFYSIVSSFIVSDNNNTRKLS